MTYFSPQFALLKILKIADGFGFYFQSKHLSQLLKFPFPPHKLLTR